MTLTQWKTTTARPTGSAWAPASKQTSGWRSNLTNYSTTNWIAGKLHPYRYSLHLVLNGTYTYGGQLLSDEPTNWTGNIAALANLYAFDDLNQFNSGTKTYDGIVIGQGSTANVPSKWN